MTFQPARSLVRLSLIGKRVANAVARQFPKRLRQAALVLASTVFALGLAEAVVRIFALDWSFFSKTLYYQRVDLDSHQADPDPKIRFRLKPGRKTYQVSGKSFEVGINSLGVRGPERSVKKPEGVFRIVVVGASNVYGALVSDGETWPARLEASLNRDGSGRFEVWNLGTSAYTAVQMSAIAAEAVERYEPDLVIYAPTNVGAIPFLWETDVRPYFRENPGLWRGFFPIGCPRFPSWISYDDWLWLISHVGLYRMAAVRFMRSTNCDWLNSAQEQWNIEAAQKFFRWAEPRVKVCLFFFPGTTRMPYQNYFAGMKVPILELRADNMPPEYREIHPPAYVLNWYGERIAAWLRDQGLVPIPVARGGGAS